jgi:hypothetical protein
MIEIQRETKNALLLIWALAGVVFVLVVRIELDMFTYREQAASIEGGRAPFAVLAQVIRLNRDIWNEMVRMEPKSAL